MTTRVHWETTTAVVVSLAALSAVGWTLTHVELAGKATGERFAAAPLLMVLGVGFAVVGLGAVDPSLALRHTLSIGITGMVWIALSALAQDLTARVIFNAMSVPGAASWLIVVGTAVLLTPLQRRIDRWLDVRKSTARAVTASDK